MKKYIYKKYSKEDQRSLAIWAADCAERVLLFFEEAFPEGDRLRNAIETCRMWVRTGEFKMAVIREASLGAHAAACEAKDNDVACFAARAAGQAVATAHVAQHAYGGAYYALKAIAASDPANAEENVSRECDWQSQHLPESLRQEIMSRIEVKKNNRGKISIRMQKGEGF